MSSMHDKRVDTRAETEAVTTLVVGLGATGLSIARFLAARGEAFALADSRNDSALAERVASEFPEHALHLGPFSSELFGRFERLLLSPGIPFNEPSVVEARDSGAEVIGDIELFAREATAPVIAITGSNGKSTVTELVGAMAREAGRKVAVGGNLGTPALELLDDAIDLYVLELSSFQLEQTRSLKPAAAVVLNLSDDHLDRHGTMAAYGAIKASIYSNAVVSVINRDDPAVVAMGPTTQMAVSFGLDEPVSEYDYGIVTEQGRQWLARGGEKLLACDEMKLPGSHNRANALAALALGSAVGLSLAAMTRALRHFAGLDHRCAWVAEVGGVTFYNDSKGTNVGATLAAIEGMPGEKLVLIAGGEGKGADFTPLRSAVAHRARAVVLIGRDAPRIAEVLEGAVPVTIVASMDAAVDEAAAAAAVGDCVLLSPACASFDMFDNYKARGDAFVAAVEALE